MKTPEQNFTDWEAWVFGYGYGTGEPHIIPALRRFFELCKHGESHAYRYDELEHALDPAVAWLLINAMCHADVIDYGTSPRGGWMTKKGERVRAFVLGHTVEELLEMTGRNFGDDGHVHCDPDTCNCGPNGYRAGVRCPNPFWTEHLP